VPPEQFSSVKLGVDGMSGPFPWTAFFAWAQDDEYQYAEELPVT
jgi:hypothetical protein